MMMMMMITTFRTPCISLVRDDESLGTQELSVYDIKEHPDFKYRMGQIVINIGSAKVFMVIDEVIYVDFETKFRYSTVKFYN